MEWFSKITTTTWSGCGRSALAAWASWTANNTTAAANIGAIRAGDSISGTLPGILTASIAIIAGEQSSPALAACYTKKAPTTKPMSGLSSAIATARLAKAC